MIDVYSSKYATNPDGARLMATTVKGIISIQTDENTVGNGTSGKIYYIDCAPNPFFPKAVAGEIYIVTGDGKIGGKNGRKVKKGTMLLCITKEVDSGEYLERSDDWLIIDKDDKSEVGPDPDGDKTPGGIPSYNPDTGVWENSGLTPSDEDINIDNPSSTKIPTERAIAEAIAKTAQELLAKMMESMRDAISNATRGVSRLIVINCAEGGSVPYDIPEGTIFHSIGIGIVTPYNPEAQLSLICGDTTILQIASGDFVLGKVGMTLMKPSFKTGTAPSVAAFVENYQYGGCVMLIEISDRPIENSDAG